MTVHLIKLSVGIEDVDHLADVQKRRLEISRRAGQPAELLHVTRSFPKRSAEVLDGGSIYWVIKRMIRVRQRIVELRETINADGKPACAIVLDPKLVHVERRSHRAFQGWRYLQSGDAPRDLRDLGHGAEDLPDDMADALKDLGLI